MFNPTAYENSRPDGYSVLEITSGFVPDNRRGEAEPRVFVPLQRTELKGEVIGPLAALRLTQTYLYSSQQCDKVLEAVYRFPLPGDAAVSGVQVRFGKVKIRAQLQERQQAETTYENAKQQGQQAALLTSESPDVFTLHVAGLKPDEPVTIETSYVQLARAEGVGWSLRIPLTTAPRYTRSDEVNSRYAQGQPLFLMRDPGHRFSLDLRFQGVGTVKSSTHQLKATPLTYNEIQENPDGTQYQSLRVQLLDGEVLPDRDCVLTWNPPQQQQATLQVVIHDDPQSEHTYFLALVAPPATHEKGHGVAREVILLVDHSGSMEGPKWEAADWAVKRFLMDLHDHDTFALGLFHNTTRWFDRQPRAADKKTVQEAIHFLEKHKDSGGTELGVALEQALHQQRSRDERSRHVLIATDAEVSDEGRIIRLATAEATQPQRRRISVLCIDAAPNSYLAGELAERGGGIAKFLTSDPAQEDITTALDEVLADWTEPVLSGLRLEVNRPHVEAAGREINASNAEENSGFSAVDLGDLPTGRAVWVVGRVPRTSESDLYFRLTTSHGREVALFGVQPSAQGDDEHHAPAALKALFGARRVAGLKFLMHSGYTEAALKERLVRLGYDPVDTLTQAGTGRSMLYAENTDTDEREALRNLLVREALDYGLASAETAFVAVREEDGKLIEGTIAVGNALPHGWSGSFASTMDFMAQVAGPTRSAAPRGRARMAQYMAAPMTPPSSMPAASSAPKGNILGLFKKSARRTSVKSAYETVNEDGAPDSSLVLFSDIPAFHNGEAVLFDSSRIDDVKALSGSNRISRLMVRFPQGAPQNIDADLTLLIYVEDLAAPRAKVRLADVLQQGGERPLNLVKSSDQVLRIVLIDPASAWTANLPPLEIAIQIG